MELLKNIANNSVLLKAAFPSLTGEELEALIQAAVVLLRLNYHINLSSDGKYDTGSGEAKLSYLHITEEGVETVLNDYDQSWEREEFTAEEIEMILTFILTNIPRLTVKIIALFRGQMPPIIVRTKPKPETPVEP